MTNHLEVADLMAENSRLRAALEVVAETANYLCGGEGVVGDLEKIARAALSVCGDPQCRDPNCTYGKGSQRCQKCGHPTN